MEQTDGCFLSTENAFARPSAPSDINGRRCAGSGKTNIVTGGNAWIAESKRGSAESRLPNNDSSFDMRRNGANRSSSLSDTSQPARDSLASLAISEEIFDEKVIRGLIDEWIIPSLVDAFLRNLVPESEESEDNICQR